METQSNHQYHWICGNLEDRVMVLAIIAMAALSPVVVWFY